MNTRPPLITWDRIRITLVLVAYILSAESATPLPFVQTGFGRLLFGLLVLEVGRQFYTYRQETKAWAYLAAERRKQSFENWRSRFTDNTRYRMRRTFYLLLSLYATGFLIDGVTTRCDGAVSCALTFPQIIIQNLPQMIQVAFYIAIGMAQLVAMFWGLTKVGSYKLIPPSTIKVRFDQVYGQDKAKEKMQEQVRLLDYPDDIEAAGGHLPKGVLLTGPPGTGKTMLAQAVAGESNKPFIFVAPGSFASAIMGINFLKVYQLFKAIRKQSLRYGGVTVFIDEIDALGNRGGEVEDNLTDDRPCVTAMLEYDPDNQIVMMGGQDAGTLTAFLAGMDGMEEPRGMVNKLRKILGFPPLPPPNYRYFMVGATNRPSVMDPALKRAGRFGREIHVGFPDFPGLLETVQGYAGQFDHGLSDSDMERIARDMHRGTGAKVKDAFNEALLATFRREGDRVPISAIDILDALLWKEYGEATGRAELPEDDRAVAIHEAGHAVAAHHLRRDYYDIRFGSIEKRGKTGGMIASTAVAERQFKLRTAMLADIAVSLASGVAEVMFYEETSNGVGGDYRAATHVARQMAQHVGMGEHLQVVGDSMMNQRRFDEGVEKILVEGYGLASSWLHSRSDQIEAVADLLIADGTVLGHRIHDLLDDMEGTR